MYVSSNARKGLGLFETPAGLTPGPETLTPESVAWGEGWWAGVESGTPMTPAPSQGQTMTQWLNANAGKVAIGVAGFLALVFVAKAGR